VLESNVALGIPNVHKIATTTGSRMSCAPKYERRHECHARLARVVSSRDVQVDPMTKGNGQFQISNARRGLTVEPPVGPSRTH
jgi:hypothetical protein